jgi:hypothetical protein
MPAGLIFLILFVRFAYSYSQRKKGVAPARVVFRWRSLVLALLAVSWVLFAISVVTALAIVVAEHTPQSPTSISVAVLVVTLTVASGAWFLAPWQILRSIAKRGKFKLVYYLAHFAMPFVKTGEPYAAASFGAALALAYRGSPTRAEVDWINVRLAKESRALGLFGAALGLTQALEGRLAKDEGRDRDADDFRDRARILFGTITYLSPAACPRPIRIFANEYLAIDSATRGEWGAIEAVEERDLSPNVLALRGWLRKKLLKSEEKETRRSRATASLPLAVELAQRREKEPAPMTPDEAFAHVSREYVALMKGDRRPPAAILNLLQRLDLFFDPRSPMCRLPPEVVSDDEAVAQVADAISESVFEAVKSRGVPVFALKMHGAISARVYQKLESHVLGDLNAAMAAVRDRTVRSIRGTNRDEWVEVSRVRALYRRLEYTLGSSAAGSASKALLFNYGNFGVMLSESIPRRRPLAHAVFHVLRNEANRFGNPEALARENKNMVVTSRAD